MRFAIRWRVTPLLLLVLAAGVTGLPGLLGEAYGADGAAAAPMKLEKCWFERHRAVSPPGGAVIRVHFGMTEKTERLVDANELFTFLKAAEGKTCEVDWLAAQREINEWLVKLNGQTFTHEDELEALIVKQARTAPVAAPSVSVAPSPAPSAWPAAGPTSVPPAASTSDCEARLAEAREQISGLKAGTYDAAAQRGARIDSVLGILGDLSKCFMH
jgi:hypothetical protein